MGAHGDAAARRGVLASPLRAIVEGGGRDLLVAVRNNTGEAIAEVVCHIQGNRAIYWAGVSVEEGLQARANHLCLHAGIQACRQLGVSQFELGRFQAREPSEKERAITQYKASFGGRLVRIVGFETPPGRAHRAVRRITAIRAPTS